MPRTNGDLAPVESSGGTAVARSFPRSPTPMTRFRLSSRRDRKNPPHGRRMVSGSLVVRPARRYRISFGRPGNHSRQGACPAAPDSARRTLWFRSRRNGASLDGPLVAMASFASNFFVIAEQPNVGTNLAGARISPRSTNGPAIRPPIDVVAPSVTTVSSTSRFDPPPAGRPAPARATRGFADRDPCVPPRNLTSRARKLPRSAMTRRWASNVARPPVCLVPTEMGDPSPAPRSLPGRATTGPRSCSAT